MAHNDGQKHPDTLKANAPMKSFRIYSREPVKAPARVASDYAPEEIGSFREKFRPIAERYRQRSRIAGFGMAAFFLCIGLGFVVPKHLLTYLWIPAICSWLFMFFVARMPVCPACQNRLDASFGAFCPECGSHSLQPGGWTWSPRCESCGKSMRRGKGRRYKIRACTHCGLMLDDQGL
ncbi:MAG TPA: hypothetical protein VGM54_21175 [Chthoniobacter sp.]|jgi:hypothetical protein